MILSYANIIHYTINQLSWKIDDIHIQRMMKRCSIDDFFVMGDYLISQNAASDFPTRNRSFSIENQESDEFCFFIKQSKIFVRENLVSILRESLFYQIMQSQNIDLNNNLPKFYDFNSKETVLILSFLKGTSNFADYRKQESVDKTKNIQIAKSAGTLLRKFHDKLRPLKPNFKKKAPIFFNVNPIAVFDIDFEYLDFQEQYSKNLEPIIKTFNKYQDSYFLRDIVVEAQRIWKTSESTIIQGDFKAANILVNEIDINKLYFIDWEYAVEGSPEYDLATFLYYELVVNNFKLLPESSELFINLLANYYNTEDINDNDINKIVILLKAILIDYWVGNQLTKALNPEDEENKVEELINIFKILKFDNNIFVDNNYFKKQTQPLIFK